MAQVSSRDPQIREKSPRGWNRDAAKLVGEAMAAKLKSAGIESAVFDRGGFVYHGRIKALADAMREAGLKL